MPAIPRSSSAWPASMHSFRNTELSTTRTAGLSPDQRPVIVGGQTRSPAPAGWTSTRYLLSV
jgi:hypothetical protein